MHNSRAGPFSFDVEEVRMSSRRFVIAGRRGERLTLVVTCAVWTTCSLGCSNGDLKTDYKMSGLVHLTLWALAGANRDLPIREVPLRRR